MKRCLALSFCLAMLLGCSKDPTPVFGNGPPSKFLGTWVAHTDNSNLGGLALKIDPDGQVIYQDKDFQMIGSSFYLPGTWREEPGKLIINVKSVSIIGKFYADDKIKANLIKAYGDDFPLNKDHPLLITWINDKSFECVDLGRKTKNTYVKRS